MMTIKLTIGASLLGAAFTLTSFGAFAAEPNGEQVAMARQFALNNMEYVTYHELGHMLIETYNLPILAREEDAADYIATLSMLGMETEEADRTLADAAYGWLLMDANEGEVIEQHQVYDPHSLKLQRVFGAVCLMIGNDPERFEDVADSYEIDPDRREQCFWDFAQAANSMSALISPHIMSDGDKGADVSVTYGEIDGDESWLREMIMDSKIIDEIAHSTASELKLPEPVSIETRQCGKPDAYYSEGEIVICYELVANFMDMFIADMKEHGHPYALLVDDD